MSHRFASSVEVEMVDLTGRAKTQRATLTVDVGTAPPDLSATATLFTPEGSYTGTGPDLFDALKDLRRQTEPYCPAVQAARRFTWPSPNAREGGAVVVNDLAADRFRLLPSLDPAEPEELVTVDEQERQFAEYAGRRGPSGRGR
ncbi:MAG: hypothetical protein ACRDYU_09960 [Actinomycetes bacterium]